MHRDLGGLGLPQQRSPVSLLIRVFFLRRRLRGGSSSGAASCVVFVFVAVFVVGAVSANSESETPIDDMLSEDACVLCTCDFEVLLDPDFGALAEEERGRGGGGGRRVGRGGGGNVAVCKCCCTCLLSASVLQKEQEQPFIMHLCGRSLVCLVTWRRSQLYDTLGVL